MTEYKKLPFFFSNNRISYDTAKVFYFRLTGEIYNVEQLLEALFWGLWLPGYFGFNWNALYDCLRNLSWIPDRKIVLLHDGLPKIDSLNLKVYLEVLRDAVLDWDENDEHMLEVVFKEQDYEKVREALAAA